MKIFISNPLGDDFSFRGNHVSHMSYNDYFDKNYGILDYFKYGLSGTNLFFKLRNPEYLHKLYREKDPDYFGFLNAFREKYCDYDVIVMNPGVDLVHPEFLHAHFKNSLKILHFIDDPHTTYSYGLPFSWAFDGATYVSPSYSSEYSMEELLLLAGFNAVKWTPHCVTNTSKPEWTLLELERQLVKRSKKAVYVGGFYIGKTDRLIELKHSLGNRLEIYGRFPVYGLTFSLCSMMSRRPILYRVKKLSDSERDNIYRDSAVGVNMHLSWPSVETGNARLYELAYRGVAQVVDTSEVSLVGSIFEPDYELLTYQTIDECAFKVNELLSDDGLRINLALKAYERAITKYSYDYVLADMIQWFNSLLKS